MGTKDDQQQPIIINSPDGGGADAPAAPIRGTSQGEILDGSRGDDLFDSDAGGDDALRGGRGSDTYLFGYGTGSDVIEEYHRNTGNNADVDKVVLKAGIATGQVRLNRAKGDHLVIELLNEAGVVTDRLAVRNYYRRAAARIEQIEFSDGTVWDEDDILARAAIRGNADDEKLIGSANDDVFDSNGGGNDRLRGRGGNDVYWLGHGTGRDMIQEYAANTDGNTDVDKIMIKAGIATEQVRLRREGGNLLVELLNEAGAVTDSLTVKHYYERKAAQIEQIVFSDGTVWNEDDILAPTAIRGEAGNETLTGSANDDVFDGNAGGDDTLRGGRGSDVYWFGHGTGHDTIQENADNAGDADVDKIMIKPGIAPAQVRLRREEGNLLVELLNGAGEVTDSLTVRHHYKLAAARIEQIVFSDGTVWNQAYILEHAGITGEAGNDILRGGDGADVFDGNAGGDDKLRGGRGSDEYRLGYGTGHDTIQEYIANDDDADSSPDVDKIKIKPDITPAQVRLSSRDGNLRVELLNEAGAVTDSLTVKRHYKLDAARIEQIVFSDETVWDQTAIAGRVVIGGSDHNKDTLIGSAAADEFDTNAGANDILQGRGGNDVYWLGHGTDHDTIQEAVGNSESGDAGDTIRIKSAITDITDVRLRRVDNDLLVEIRGAGGTVTDSLTVKGHFEQDAAKVERIETDSEVLVETQFIHLINAIAAFGANPSSADSETAIYDQHWDDKTLTSSDS